MPTLILLLKITLLLLVTTGITMAMARAAAGARHLVWLVTLLALLALPALGELAPLRLPVLPAATSAVVPAAPVLEVPVETASTPPVNPAPRSNLTAGAGAAAPVDAPWTALQVLAAVWAVVALGLLGRLALGVWSVRRIVRRARVLDEPSWQAPLFEISDRLGLEHAPRLLRSDDVRMPFAAGLLSPTIVLPADADDWSAERRSAVLIHELAHVRRRDLIGHTLSRIACAVYWFHPLVWTAARRLRAESERACDDLALVFGARPSDYAEHLLDIVTCVRDHRTPAVALAMAHRREFEGRMLAILDPELTRRQPGRAATMTLASAVGVTSLAIGAVMPVPRAAAAAPVDQTVAAQTEGTRTASAEAQSARPDAISTDTPPQVAIDGPREAAADPVAAAPQAEPVTGTAPAAMVALLANDSLPPDERVEVLIRTLRTDSSARVRRIAAWGLGRYAEEREAAEALVSAAERDRDARVREMAVWALAGARRNGDADAALARIIGRESDADVRATAVWAAGSIGAEEALDALTTVLGDSDARLRADAAWSIGNIEPDRAPAALVTALSDRDRGVRITAAWALYNISDPAAADALNAAFARETDSAARTAIVRALLALGDQSVEAIQRLITSDDTEVRAMAIAALAGGSAVGPWPQPRPRPRPFP